MHEKKLLKLMHIWYSMIFKNMQNFIYLEYKYNFNKFFNKQLMKCPSMIEHAITFSVNSIRDSAFSLLTESKFFLL